MTTLKNNLFCREQRGAAIKIENKAEVIVRLRREPGVVGSNGGGGPKDSGGGLGGLKLIEIVVAAANSNEGETWWREFCFGAYLYDRDLDKRH